MKLTVILFLALLLRLMNINQSFWLDEAAQVIESARALSQQLNIVSDFHPPLYHLLLHFWMRVGNSEIWIRMLSVIFGVCSIIVLYKIGISVGKKSQALLAGLFLSLSPYHIWYSQEARPYMLFVFVSLLSSYFLIKGKWISYTAAVILSLYTSYFAPFLLVSHFFYILFLKKKDLKHFLKSLILSAIFFTPWIPKFMEQLRVGTGGFFSGWTDVVSFSPLRAIPLTFAKFILGKGSIENNLIYGLVVLQTFLVFILSILKIRKEASGRVLMLLLGIPFFFAILISFFIPIVAPQRLIFLLPIFYLIISCGIFRFSFPWRILLILIIFLTNILGIFQYYTDPYVQREKWREATSFVEEDGGNAISLFVFPDPFAPYLWYKKDKVEAVGIAPKFIIRDEDLIVLSPKLADKKRVYLFQYLTGLTDPKEKTRKFLIDEGYKESSIKDFPGVGFVYIYEKR